MKKIKKLWVENRVVFVLISILAVCFITIVVVASSFFLASKESNYRSVDTEKYPITEEFKTSYYDSVKESKIVNQVEMRVSENSRVIYINIKYTDEASLDEAKSVAVKSVDLFSENNLSYYDINFILSNNTDDGFVIMGARNSNGSGVVWNNNTAVKESEK